MTYDRTAPKRAVSLNLNDDLVQKASIYTHDLSNTLEQLLDDFVAREEARHRLDDGVLDGVIAKLNAFHAKHGLLSDEFSGL